MGKYFLASLIILLCGSVAPGLAEQKEPGLDDWQLIKQDPSGNKLYVSPVKEQVTDKSLMHVWLKFETNAVNSPSPMLFFSELDCAKGLIRRLEVKLYKPTCSTDNELVQTMSFDGEWDSPAKGIETDMQEFMCDPKSIQHL